MTRPLDPSGFESSPEAKQIADLMCDLLARRSDWGRQPRRRLIGESEIKQGIEALLVKTGENVTSKFWKVATSILAYTIAEFVAETWENGYNLGYQIGAAEPEPTLKSAAIAVGMPDAWPTLEAFLEYHRERLELRAPPCWKCGGLGYLGCDDPQHGDSTWDHNCNDGQVCDICKGAKTSTRTTP